MEEEQNEFDAALMFAAAFCLRCMNQESVDDILIVAITPNGAMQFIGTGAMHPTNEEVVLSEGARLIFRSDLKEAVKILAQTEGAGPEAPEIENDDAPEESGE